MDIRVTEDKSWSFAKQDSRKPPGSLDIVFMDPPFDSRLERQAMALLLDRELIRPGGFVYIETSRNAPAFHPGLGWDIAKEKTLGQVRMLLLKNIGGV